MSNHFFFVQDRTELNLQHLDSEFAVEQTHGGHLFIKKEAGFAKTICDGKLVFLIGELYNVAALQTMLGQVEGNVWALNNAELLALLRARLGDTAFSLVEGDFCLLTVDDKGDIEIITDPHGFNPVHVIENDNLWISNNLKIVGKIEGARAFNFKPVEEVIAHSMKPDDFTPVINGRKLKPGSLSKIRSDEQSYHYIETRMLSTLINNNLLSLKKDRVFEIIDSIFTANLQGVARTNATIGIPLSGGLDSSLITALASQSFKKVKTWSIGTEISNEFPFAQIVSDTLGTEHEVKILSDRDVMSGILEAIYHNEIFDGLSSEIQSGLFNVYKLASGKVDALLTGYGSDLLFGGILNPGSFYSAPNKLLAEQVYRTKWTGEFSTSGASHYGLKVYHPFWNNSLISFCRNLDPDFKIKDNEVKNVLREYTGSLKSLPDEIVWRKKIGIHEGSSVNKAFANLLNTSVDNYQEKTRFAYTLYKEFMQEKLLPEEATPEKLRELMAKS